MCLNAGTVLWYRHDYSHEVLMDWWHSTMESYADNPLKRSTLSPPSLIHVFSRKFRLNWPWEQDRQMAIYHRSPQHIQIASQPNSSMLEKDTNGSGSGWCLSHLPGYHCFISHVCANPASKQRLRVLYQHPGWDEEKFLRTNQLPFPIRDLKFH
jgi:hypothetical protein